MNIAVFFGGRSCEHDISIITGVQVLNALGDGYRVLPVYMKDGGFYTSDLMPDVGFFENPNLKKATRIWLIDGSFYTRKGMLLLKKETPDVALICCHGGEGENGVLQGFLEYNGVPYTSAGLIASSVCMDKSIAKQLLDGLMLNTMPSITVSRGDFEKNTNDVIRHVSTFLEYPLIVKPSGLGSRRKTNLKRQSKSRRNSTKKSLSKTRWKISKNLIARRIPTDETFTFRKWKVLCPGTIFCLSTTSIPAGKTAAEKGKSPQIFLPKSATT